MKTCYIMIGVPGCGKTSTIQWLKGFWHGEDFRVFSQDNAYFDFAVANHTGQFYSDNETDADIYAYCFKFMQENEKEFAKFLEARWRDCLQASVLVIDRTNLSRKARTKYLQEARAKGFKIVAIEVHVPLQTALARQQTRADKRIPDKVVRDMWFNQQGLLVGSEVDQMICINGTQDVDRPLQALVENDSPIIRY